MMKELTSPSALLQKHLDTHPDVVIVASISGTNGNLLYDTSAPAQLGDLFFLHKLLEHKLNHDLEQTMKSIWEEKNKEST